MRQRCNAAKDAIIATLEAVLFNEASRVRVVTNPRARRVELWLDELTHVLAVRVQHALASLARHLGGTYDYNSHYLKLS